MTNISLSRNNRSLSSSSPNAILVFHALKPYNKSQMQEINLHVWFEMEKIARELEKHNLSFKDIGAGFEKSAEEIINELIQCFRMEWVHLYGMIYREWHWEKVHPMP